MRLQFDQVGSPLGEVTLVVGARGVCALDFSDRAPWLRAQLARHFGPVALRRTRDPQGVSTRVRAYFEGRLDALEAIPVDPHGTSFQRRVWTALRDVPCGRTIGYGEVACRIGRPGAARAVGASNAHNPIALLVPCHRVIGSGGELRGYAGGLARKRWLLEHEGALRSRALID